MATSPPLSATSVYSSQGRPIASPGSAGYALGATPMATSPTLPQSPTLAPALAAATSYQYLAAAQAKMATNPLAQSKLNQSFFSLFLYGVQFA